MPTIDTTPALVLVDLQEGLRGIASVHPLPDVLARAAELSAEFRRRALPVVLVTANGQPPGRTERGGLRELPAGFDDVAAELEPAESDHRVSKQRWGAFTGTDLDAVLRSRGVTQVVVSGVATSLGVESTARSAFELGYHVVLATDAMTDLDADAHTNSVERIFPRLGERATTAEIVAALP